MVQWIIYSGSALMIFNIIGFIRFAAYIRRTKAIKSNTGILYVPIVLLIFFFLGYVGIAIFGKPDILVAFILLGGSIFVFIMYFLLSRITKRIIENERLEAELRAAEESSKAKSAFLASMSHEMRTPMNVILGLSTMAQRNPELSEETRKHLEKITQSGEHMLQMINNVLDMNVLESGKLELKNQNFYMERLLEQVSEVGAMFCREKGLTWSTKISDTVKGCYYGDKDQMEQVLLAILSNAAKYTDAPGTVSFQVENTVYNDNPNAVKFIVADTGIGIDEEFLPKIYELFAQEDSSYTNRFGGSGIGLAVTKSKVDLLGGKISVKSKKGEGSEFTVVIPLQVNALADGIVNVDDEREYDDSDLTLEGRRILIVEDLPENAEIVTDLLEMEEAECEHAENGQIAVEMFTGSGEGYYDAILMDLRMPVMNGWEAAKTIRASAHPQAKTIPILALTANAFESDIRQSFETGMNEHLVKPVDADQLYAALKHFM